MSVNYKSFVGPEESFHSKSNSFFRDLISAGLNPKHNLLDVGCGSLSLGRLLIPFLEPQKYHGIEPEKKWLEEGLKHEVPKDTLKEKEPKFLYNSDFDFTNFNTKFDIVIASQVFIHCGIEQFEKCLVNLRNHLKENGCLFITIKISNETIEKPHGLKKRYKYSSHRETTYSQEDFKEIIKKYNFREKEIRSYKDKKTKLFRIHNPEGVERFRKRIRKAF
jgi:cyclopropane fatty-acyl-phospholipid synthase-like methyltransferase